MSYSANYIDSKGRTREVSITEEDYREALKNDYQEIMRKYNPKYVSIQRIQAKAGEALHLKVTVNAPTHYLATNEDSLPKACESMSVDIICYPGYPLTAVKAAYAPNRFLASPNVFRSGAACIDKWIPLTSSLITVMEKLLHDIIHDPAVTRYDSMANTSMEKWHKDGVASGKFPTVSPKLLYAPEEIPLPPRRGMNKARMAAPPLPGRRH